MEMRLELSEINMAIDITCFTKLITSDLQRKLDDLQTKNPSVFPGHYLLYKARKVDNIGIEISNEYGLEPKSLFRISVINKTLEISTDQLANMIRKSLGADNVIVLLNGEDLI